jgi:hypothetical protein
LNGSNIKFDWDRYWNDTQTTATVFTVGGSIVDGQVNKNGNNHIAYCFHSVEGYSRIGVYEGNAASNGVYVHCGFRPAFILLKAVESAVQHWWMYDNRREGYNADNNALYANLNIAEGTTDQIDILSSGFKLRTSSASQNGSGVDHIYIAFAEQPFKYSNAR